MAARALLTAALAAALLVGPAPAAQGQEPPREVARQALEQYQQGITHYRAARYEEAIEAFSRAFLLDPTPILIFNIGQAQWKKGDREAALSSYRRYLEMDPNTANRAQVEARIRELEAPPAPEPAIEPPAEPARAEPNITTLELRPLPATPAHAEPMVVSTPEPQRPLWRRSLFWVVVGTVAASTAVTVALLASRRGPDRFDCGADCNWSTVSLPGR